MATTGEWATASRMNAELSRLLRTLRRESEVPRMMATGLDAIIGSLGAEGIAVIRCISAPPGTEPEVLHRAGTIAAPPPTALKLLQLAEVGTPAASIEPDTRPIAVAVCRQLGVEKLAVVIWRRRGARVWVNDDMPLIDAFAGIVRLLLDRSSGAGDAFCSEPIGSLAPLDQRTFIAEVTRHIARLEGDQLPGTLMLAEVDNLANTIRLLGPDGRDRVMNRAVALLRGAVRPTDLVGRTGDTEFAVWLSGADFLTVAERAENLCLEAPSQVIGSDNVTATEVSFSIGIATRLAGESFSDLAGRAGQAMRQVKAEGGGYWRVSLARAA